MICQFVFWLPGIVLAWLNPPCRLLQLEPTSLRLSTRPEATGSLLPLGGRPRQSPLVGYPAQSIARFKTITGIPIWTMGSRPRKVFLFKRHVIWIRHKYLYDQYKLVTYLVTSRAFSCPLYLANDALVTLVFTLWNLSFNYYCVLVAVFNKMLKWKRIAAI